MIKKARTFRCVNHKRGKLYCPKCGTEYKKGFNTCADCDISLVEELPSGQEHEPARRHPIKDQIKKSLAFIRNNKKASWTFAVIAGICFYVAYGYSKNLWREDSRLFEYVASLIDPSSKVNVFFITIGINVLVDLTSAFVASLLCGVLFVYILQKDRIIYCFGAVASFFLLYIRGWHFWKAPDLGMQISSFTAPFLVATVFVFIVWLLSKLSVHRLKQKN